MGVIRTVIWLGGISCWKLRWLVYILEWCRGNMIVPNPKSLTFGLNSGLNCHANNFHYVI